MQYFLWLCLTVDANVVALSEVLSLCTENIILQITDGNETEKEVSFQLFAWTGEVTAPAGSDELHVCNVTTRAAPKIAAKMHSTIAALNNTAERSKQKPTKSFSSDPQEGKRNKRDLQNQKERTENKKQNGIPFLRQHYR